MIFNNAGRQLNESYTFNYGDIDIRQWKLILTLESYLPCQGTSKNNQQVLRQKVLRAYFGMKKIYWPKKCPKIGCFQTVGRSGAARRNIRISNLATRD